MAERRKKDRDVIEFVGIDSLDLQDHLLGTFDEALDFKQVNALYCEDNGRPSVDPIAQT